MNNVAFVNGKGGCGKTTSMFHTVGELAYRGNKVLAIDFDKQRNTTGTLLMYDEDEVELSSYDWMAEKCRIQDIVKKAHYVKQRNGKPVYCGVDVLPSDVRFEDESAVRALKADIKNELAQFVKDNGYDWVVVDMPASNKSLNEICFTQVVDNVIVPFTSDLFSINGYGDLIREINEARATRDTTGELHILGVFLSRYCAINSLDRELKGLLQENFMDSFIDVQIPMMSDVRIGVGLGKPMCFNNAQECKSRDAYRALVTEMEKRISEYSR